MGVRCSQCGREAVGGRQVLPKLRGQGSAGESHLSLLRQGPSPRGRLCLHCGYRLTKPCPYCGAELLGKEKYCPECGRRMEGKDIAEGETDT